MENPKGGLPFQSAARGNFLNAFASINQGQKILFNRAQLDIVHQTLAEIDARDKPTYIVFNKIDAFRFVRKEADDLSPPTRENMSLEELKRTWMANVNGACVFVSAKNRNNLEELRDLLYDKVKEIHARRYPYDDFLY